MKLRAWRAQRVLTAEQLAQRAGISVATIYAIERGRELPRPKTAQKLAQALNVDPIEIDEVKEYADKQAGGTTKDAPAG